MAEYTHRPWCVCALVNSCNHEVMKREQSVKTSSGKNDMSFTSCKIYRIHVTENETVWACQYDMLGKCVAAVEPFDIGRYFVESELEVMEKPDFIPIAEPMSEETVAKVIAMQADKERLKQGYDSRNPRSTNKENLGRHNYYPFEESNL